MRTRYCEACGAAVRSGARFCGQCGGSLGDACCGGPVVRPASNARRRSPARLLWLLALAALGFMCLRASQPGRSIRRAFSSWQHPWYAPPVSSDHDESYCDDAHDHESDRGGFEASYERDDGKSRSRSRMRILRRERH